MKEIFKDIKNYENMYQVSNLGNVKSLKRKGVRIEKILKYRTGKYGYNYVVLVKNKKRKTLKIHRLVAETFIQNPKNKPEVNHIDGNKQNNVISNLEWVTKSENVLHSIKIGLRKPGIGEKHSQAKLKVKQVREIRRLLKYTNLTQNEIAKKFNIGQYVISQIKTNKTWKGLGLLDD